MHHHLRIFTATLIAAASLAALVGTASARNLSISNPNIRIMWSSLEFTGAATGAIRCKVTLEGTFHSRTIDKVANRLIGYITRVDVGRPCTNGQEWAYNGVERLNTTTLSNSLPWHLYFVRFSGSLPNITSVTIGISGIRIRLQDPLFFILCVYTAGPTNGAPVFTASRNTTTGVIDWAVLSTGNIASETGGCPTQRFASKAEDGLIVLLGTNSRISVTLI